MESRGGGIWRKNGVGVRIRIRGEEGEGGKRG